MKAADIRSLSHDEIAKELEEAHEALFNIRFRLATMQLRNHREIRQVKKNIARLQTIIREKELGIS